MLHRYLSLCLGFLFAGTALFSLHASAQTPGQLINTFFPANTGSNAAQPWSLLYGRLPSVCPPGQEVSTIVPLMPAPQASRFLCLVQGNNRAWHMLLRADGLPDTTYRIESFIDIAYFNIDYRPLFTTGGRLLTNRRVAPFGQQTLVRLLPNGLLDTTFRQGPVRTEHGYSPLAEVAGGHILVTDNRTTVLRLRPDGVPDTTFRPHTLPLPVLWTRRFGDGKVYACLTTNLAWGFTLVRLSEQGRIDSSFTPYAVSAPNGWAAYQGGTSPGILVGQGDSTGPMPPRVVKLSLLGQRVAGWGGETTRWPLHKFGFTRPDGSLVLVHVKATRQSPEVVNLAELYGTDGRKNTTYRASQYPSLARTRNQGLPSLSFLATHPNLAFADLAGGIILPWELQNNGGGGDVDFVRVLPGGGLDPAFRNERSPWQPVSGAVEFVGGRSLVLTAALPNRYQGVATTDFFYVNPSDGSLDQTRMRAFAGAPWLARYFPLADGNAYYLQRNGQEYRLRRVNPTGLIDPTFNPPPVPPGAGITASDISLTPDGKVQLLLSDFEHSGSFIRFFTSQYVYTTAGNADTDTTRTFFRGGRKQMLGFDRAGKALYFASWGGSWPGDTSVLVRANDAWQPSALNRRAWRPAQGARLVWLPMGKYGLAGRFPAIGLSGPLRTYVFNPDFSVDTTTTLLIGRHELKAVQNGYLLMTDAANRLLALNMYGTPPRRWTPPQPDSSYKVLPLSSGRILLYGSFTRIGNRAVRSLAQVQGLSDGLNTVSGQVVGRADGACRLDTGAIPFQNYVLQDRTSGAYAYTDAQGRYAFALDIGNYVVGLAQPPVFGQTITPVCPTSGQRTGSFRFLNRADSVSQNLVYRLQGCPFLEVRLVQGPRYPCLSTRTVVEYTNRGFVVADSAYVVVRLPQGCHPRQADLPYTLLAPGVLRFELGRVLPGRQQVFAFYDSTGCNAGTLGSLACTQAEIWPQPLTCTTPTPGWDGAFLTVRSVCQSGRVSFQVKNTGRAMAVATSYRLLRAGGLLQTATLQLAAGDSLSLPAGADSAAYALLVGQTPGTPAGPFAYASAQGCGGARFVAGNTGLGADDGSAQRASACAELAGTGSWRTAAAQPRGLGPDNRLPETAEITYTFAVRNTTADTLRNFWITDTLDAGLNPASFRLGAATHPAGVRFLPLANGRTAVQTVVAGADLLPGTSTGPAGVALVSYALRLRPGLGIGARVAQRAWISTDRGTAGPAEPIFHTVGFAPAVGTRQTLAQALRVYPNPSTGAFSVEMPQHPARLQIVDLSGRLRLEAQTVGGSPFVGTLPPGAYVIKVEGFAPAPLMIVR